jgi:ubiquinone/menaquinone biosynthesis C-methylase UbiE
LRILDSIHREYTYGRRLSRLCIQIAEILPTGSDVLDVGCGDGGLAWLIKQSRPDVKISGIDVLIRNETKIKVTPFDGNVIPHSDNSFDYVLFSDVLHHTNDPLILLREASRVARKGVILKDHLCDGFLARPTLRFMDHVGNSRHGVALPYNYWPKQRWLDAFNKLGLSINCWKEDLQLYPAWADIIFGRSLHFVARLDVG